MKLYKCTMTLYVVAPDNENAKYVAQHNVSEESYASWQSKIATLPLDEGWEDALPFGHYDDDDEKTCTEWIEN